MPKLHGLIFDLEGTLLDSVPELLQAANLMLEKYGRRPLSLDEIRDMVGDGIMALVQQAFDATGGMPSGDIFRLVQEYIHIYRNTKPVPEQIYPHVIDILEKYHKQGVILGICTNKQETASYRVLEQLGLLKYFEFIAGGDTFPVHKPNPEHVNGVIRALDVPREGCAFVGDGLNDVRAARGAKIPCIIVTHGEDMEIAERLGADRVITEFDELPDCLKSLGFENA